MNCQTVKQILSDTAYIRTSGTEMEIKCAEYLRSLCVQMGLDVKIESFPVTMYETELSILTVDGKEIECKAYNGAGNGNVCGDLYYLRGSDSLSLKKCKDKIVVVDGGVGFSLYDKLVENGAKGFITYSGNVAFRDKYIDQKEIRFDTLGQPLLPCVNIHVSDAFDIVKKESKRAEITIRQSSFVGFSHNVIADIAGDKDETVVICAHYDTTPLSEGAYDNMTGCIGLLYLAEYFAKKQNNRKVRLLFCGSEERGLLGSLAYCHAHQTELKNTVLNINLDMLGSVMGEFVAFSCANEHTAEFMKQFFSKHRYPASVKHAIRSSDSNSFVYYGIPALSFARYAPSNTGAVHTPYDKAEIVSAKTLLADMKIIAKLTDLFVSAQPLPASLDISDKIKDDVENYMKRKKSIPRI